MKNKFGFILVKPQLGENIGACARSIKNFGFSKLHIVDPKISFPNHKAKATSVGAYDIISKAKVFSKIENAVNPFNLVISLTAEFIIFYNKNKFQEASLEISYFIFINFSSVWVICFIKVKFYKYCFPKAKVMVLRQGTVVEQEINSYCNQITICDVTVVDE